MVGCASSTSVLMTTVCVDFSKLGTLIVMFIRPTGFVSKTAVEHGSLIMMSKFANTSQSSTAALSCSEYKLWWLIAAPLIYILPPDDEVLGKLKNV